MIVDEVLITLYNKQYNKKKEYLNSRIEIKCRKSDRKAEKFWSTNSRFKGFAIVKLLSWIESWFAVSVAFIGSFDTRRGTSFHP